MKIIILGDQTERTGTMNFSDKIEKDLCEQHQLSINSGKFKVKNTQKYTHNIFKNLRCQGTCDVSDHHLLTAKVQHTNKQTVINTEEQNQKITEGKYNVDKSKHESIKYLYQSRLDN